MRINVTQLADFVISKSDMYILKKIEQIKNLGRVQQVSSIRWINLKSNLYAISLTCQIRHI